MPIRGHLGVALVLLVGLLLAGCGRLAGHATINRDGSADLEVSAEATTAPAAILASGTVREAIQGYLQAQGFSLEERTTASGRAEFVARKHLRRAEELLQFAVPAASGSAPRQSLQVVRGMLLDSYCCQVDLCLADWLSSHLTELEFYLARMVLPGKELTLQVTLPWAAKKHNADFVGDGGRTLGWVLAFDQPRQLQFSLFVPSRTFLLPACGLALLLCLVWWLRRRK